VIIELKRAYKIETLEQNADKALAQIETKRYYSAILKEPVNKPLYKVGISCYKTKCHVKTVLHDR
jgi:hypothetical protein